MAEDIFADDALLQGIDSPTGDDIFADDALLGGLETAPPALDLEADPILGKLQVDITDNDQAFADLMILGDKPEADLPEPGFIPSVKSGAAGLYQSAVLTPSKLLNQEMIEFAAGNFPGSSFEVWARDEGARLGGVSNALKDYREEQPVSQTLQKLIQADSIDEFVDTFLDSEEKWTAIKEVLGASAPFSLGMMGGTAYAGLPGTFSSVFMMDWGDSYQESLAQGKSKDDALMDATIKALTQAGVDTATMGIAQVRLSANKIKDWTGQMAVQMVGGGGAEALKHELVDEDYTVGQVALEATGELAGGPLEILVARASQKKPGDRKALIAELQEELKNITERVDVQAEQTKVQDIIDQLEGRFKTEAEEFVAMPDIGDITPEQIAVNAGMTTGQIFTGANLDIETNLHLLENGTVVDKETGETVPLVTVDWEKDSVQRAPENHYARMIEGQKEYEAIEQEQVSSLEFLITQEPGNADLQIQLEQAREKLQLTQAGIAQTEAIRQEEIEYSIRAQDILRKWVAKLSPEMRIIYSSSHLGAVVRQSGNTGTENFDIKETGGHLGHTFNMQDGSTVIEVDLDTMRDGSGRVKQGVFLETLAHEFGHSLLNKEYTGTSLETKNALHNGWKRWMQKVKDAKTIGEVEELHNGKSYADLVLGMSFRGRKAEATRADKGLTGTWKVYFWGINEYLANQMEKMVGGEELIAAETRPFFSKLLSKLKEFYTGNKEAMPDQNFKDFISLLAARTTLAELERAATEGNVENQSVAVEKSYQTIKQIMDSSQLLPPAPPGGKVTKPNYGAEEFRGDLDKYNSVLKWGTTLIQMGKLNPHIVGLQKYIGLIKEWWNTKMQQTARADERLQQWNELKEKDSDNLGAFMQELTIKSYDTGERYGAESDVFKKLAEKYNMKPEMLALADLIEQDFMEVLNELEAVQVADARRTFSDDLEMAGAVAEITKNFNELRERNFFPLSRFGDQYMRVLAARDMFYEGIEYKAGETITFETFEKEKQMLERAKTFKNKDKYITEGGLMNDTQKQFAGFPPQFLSMLKERLDLNEAQKTEFESLINDLAPGKSFTKHMMHRKNTPGFSKDAVRSYANYFLHFGNYVARIKYKGVLQDAIAEVGDSASIIAKRTGNGSKRTRVQQFMQDHYEAAMNPGNELANLRALGFLWYLGFVPKSAVVNLTQVPLVTYPFLAARYGDTEAITALGKATSDAAKYWLNPKAMSKGQMDMIHELIQTGILDESMATELAAAAEGSVLQRVMPGTFLKSEKAARNIRRMAGAGAWMFQKAEKMNRRITALAAYNLAVKKGMKHDSAVEAARDAVESTQYEYARWNRPRFSQGKKSVMFLFWQYMQNSLFFLAHDPGRMRYAAMMLLFAGLSGFPFAEDAMDLFDYISKKLNKKFGEDFAPSNIRLAAREFIDQLGANPDLIMHGASRYSFGMSAVGDAIGLPIPNVDMSGSLSMGSIIPGWHAMLGDGNFDKGIGRGAEDLGGAVAAMPIQLMRAIADGNPDTLKRFERAMPSFARHMSKAYRFATRHEETLPDGTPITKFNLEDSMHRNEIVMQALGFNVTRVADAKEPHYMTKEILQYYALRRQGYMEILDYAKRTGDSKMYTKVWVDIRKFNKSLQKKGLATMGMRPSSIRRSLKDRQKQRILQEKGIIGGKQGVQVSQEVYDSFDEEEVP